ncbi:type IX secretion system membrane protein PorP/SprF [Flavobacterium humidisoli]|uniref:type IX secretion system membrane protein PorP/SprF n=1 Tax=Flavobacterium humidisoli TaxID=2937442 RepID=UPI003B84A8AC
MDFSKFNIGDDDYEFSNNLNNEFPPNVGIGLVLHNNSAYSGFSVPSLFKVKYYDNLRYSSDDYVITKEINCYFIGAKVIDLTYYLKYEPMFLLKFVACAPLQLDLGNSFILVKILLWAFLIEFLMP